MVKKQEQPIINQIVKYGVVGAVSTAIDMVLLNILKTWLGWLLWIAVAVGFIGGTVNGYYMNSRWTFSYDTEGQEAKKFSQFAIVSVIGLLLTELIVNFYVAAIDRSLALAGREISAYNVGKLIAVFLVFFWNFGANKLWTFKTNASDANAAN